MTLHCSYEEHLVCPYMTKNGKEYWPKQQRKESLLEKIIKFTHLF